MDGTNGTCPRNLGHTRLAPRPPTLPLLVMLLQLVGQPPLQSSLLPLSPLPLPLPPLPLLLPLLPLLPLQLLRLLLLLLLALLLPLLLLKPRHARSLKLG